MDVRTPTLGIWIKNIWIADFYKSGIQIIHYSDARFLFITVQEASEQIVHYSGGSNSERVRNSDGPLSFGLVPTIRKPNFG